MTYKKKLIVLFSIIGSLLLIYIFGSIFSPERITRRNAAYCWLEAKTAESARKIVINGNDDTVTLVKKNNTWFVLENDIQYPAKQMRLDDLLAALSSRGTYAIRSNNASTHEGFGLGNDNASRISIFDNKNIQLLDLLVGYPDIIGQNTYMRKYNSNEVRSGESKISTYVSGGSKSWYNFRFIPDIDNNKLNSANVQRLTVYPPATESSDEAQIFSRKGKSWIFNKSDSINKDNIDSYVQSVLFAEGDGFTDEVKPNDSMFDYRRIRIELGNGVVKDIYISDVIEENRHYAVVSGTELVYTMSGWMADRLFRDDEYFIKDAAD